MQHKMPAVVLASITILALCGCTPTADDIIARSIEARGGLEALQARETVKMTATVERPQDGLRYSMTLYRKRPTFYRAEFASGGSMAIQATDGESAWWMSPLDGVSEPTPMTADQAAGFNRQSHIDTSLQGLLPAGNMARFMDQVEEDGVELLRVEITRADGETVTLYYDAETYLVRKATRMQETADGIQEVVTLVSDYREVDGVVYSFRAERQIDGTTIAITTWESFEANVPMDDALFRIPTAH
jgi:YD repeat-containing protein